MKAHVNSTSSILDSPTKSKISTKISQSIMEQESELLKKSVNYNSTFDNDDYDLSIRNLFVKVHLLVGEKIEIKSLTLEVQESTKISDLIKMSVNIFNENFSQENSIFRLKNNYKDYSLKQSKKSGKANTDLPSFDNEAYVLNCCSKAYTLVDKVMPESQNYLISLKAQSNKPSVCKNCSIL